MSCKLREIAPQVFIASGAGFLLVSLGFLIGFHTHGHDDFFPDDIKPDRAVCVFDENQTVQGVITMYHLRMEHNMHLIINLRGIDGVHGLHVHQYGTLGDGCESVGPHFNPQHKNHGAPDAEDRHAGDFGNIEFVNQTVHGQTLKTGVSLTGVNSVLGRSMVIHHNVDDYGQGINEVSSLTGNSGERMACCVIAIAEHQ